MITTFILKSMLIIVPVYCLIFGILAIVPEFICNRLTTKGEKDLAFKFGWFAEKVMGIGLKGGCVITAILVICILLSDIC